MIKHLIKIYDFTMQVNAGYGYFIDIIGTVASTVMNSTLTLPSYVMS